MTTNHDTPGTKRIRRSSIERMLKRLLASKASSAVVRAELSGKAAEAWLELQEAAKRFNLTQEQLLGLLIQHSYAQVLKALQREENRCKTRNNLGPTPEE